MYGVSKNGRKFVNQAADSSAFAGGGAAAGFAAMAFHSGSRRSRRIRRSLRIRPRKKRTHKLAAAADS